MDKRKIVVTGTSRGLGLALVEGFIGQGHTVFGCSRSAEAMEQLGRRFPAPHDFAVVDVTDDARVREWVASILAAAGPPDLLVNNAGLINRNAPLWEVPAAEFSRVIDVNIKGTVNVIRHFAPAMIERGSGVIVNISSGWGRMTSAEVAPYCATKWAIEGMTRALAAELPGGMAVVAADPGIINTEMLQSCFGDRAANYPTPQEWAQEAVPRLLKLKATDNGVPISL